MTDGRWIDVADRVHARRYGELDLTVGLRSPNPQDVTRAALATA